MGYTQAVAGVSIEVAVRVDDSKVVRQRFDCCFGYSLLLEGLGTVFLCKVLHAMLAHKLREVSRKFLVL